jgi:FkbM family methyltransferase
MLTTRHKIALARGLQRGAMAGRRLVGLGHSASVRRGGIDWQLDLCEGIDFSIWLLGSFEPGTIRAYRRLLRPGDVALDIGANIGAHTLHLARAVGPTGRVYAFEPTDFALAKLKANLARNPDLAPRVAVRQTMLVDKAGAAPPPLYASWPLAKEAPGHSLHRGQKMASAGANAMTLDDFIAAEKIARVDFIKLDIDGFECRALKGARDTLARFRPKMVIELSPHQLAEEGDDIAELVSLLAAADYRLRELASKRPLPLDGGWLKRRIAHGGSINALAIPHERNP